MIPELGHFALILALLLAALLAHAAARRRAARHRRVDGARAAARGGSVPVHRVRVRLPRVLVRRQRLLGAERRDQLQLAASAPIPDRRDVGLARGLDAAVGVDAGRMDDGGRAQEPPPARRDGRARRWASWDSSRFGFLLFLLLTSNPFDRLFPPARRRPRL